MRRKALGLAPAFVLALALLVSAAGCGGDEDPFRVGILADCTGLLAQTKDVYVAGAALPLVERGGERTSGGVDGVEIGGRPVELVSACTEVTYVHLLVFAARRLVEDERVDVLIGPIGNPESFVFRELASRYPEVTFVTGPVTARDVTLRDPLPNVFRFLADGAQTTAGLGTYAYRDLGWRRATVVAEPISEGWELSAGFVAEFCALGGSVDRDWTSLFGGDPTAAAPQHVKSSDGVLLVADVFTPLPYLAAYGGLAGAEVSRRLLLAGAVFFDSKNLRPPRVDLTGTVVGGVVPLDPGYRPMQAHRAAFRRAFPELPREPLFEPVAVPMTAAMRAIIAAFEVADGNLEDGQAAFRKALAATRLDAPYEVALDANRQAVSPTYLERVERRGSVVRTKIIRTIRGVEQTYGGRFTAASPSPSAATPACESGAPPPWAR